MALDPVIQSRRANLLHLIRERFNDSQSNFSEVTGISLSQLGQWLASEDSPHIRNMSERSARKIEDRCSLPKGWLDRGTDLGAPIPKAVPARAWPFERIKEESVRNLSDDDRARVEGALSLAIAQLNIGLEVSKPNPKLAHLQEIVAQASEAANEDELVEIRKASVKIVGGDSVIAIDPAGEDFDGVIYVARSWLLVRGLSRDRVFAATVTGDSMAPRIQPGDLLLVNQADTEKVEGKVYGISHEGRFMAKRLKRELGRWWLCSDNPDQAAYPPISAEDGTQILGRVVMMKTELV